MTYYFHCRPTGWLAKVATRACARGPIDADSAADARRKVIAIMRSAYGGGPWKCWLRRGERRLRPFTFEIGFR